MMTLNEALAVMTVNDLKKYLDFVPNEQGGSKKADLVQRITNGLAGDKLQAQFNQLDTLQQKAVAEALYDSELRYRSQVFGAKYSAYPALSDKKGRTSSAYEPTRIRLFLYSPSNYGESNLEVPRDLAERLTVFIPKPAKATLPIEKKLPEAMEDGQPLIVRATETNALHDLPALLRLVEQGKILVGEKTGHPSAASLKLLGDALTGGDFYKIVPKQNDWEQEIGAIKAFAWPMLLQAAKLVQLNGKKLTLSKTGLGALSKPSADTLRTLWQKWQKTTVLDEFSRVDAIKGQRSKGKVMTAVAARREVIQEALCQCPVGEWVDVDSFFAYMWASRLDFEVTHDPWKLYIGDPGYGNFGYDGFGSWNVLQGRYILSLLFEYAATLGMVDVAYIQPDHARDDYRGQWGVDDLYFLSRYDGLLYVRLNALGAYCLGLTDTYQSPVAVEQFQSMRDEPAQEVLNPLKKVGTALVIECTDEASAALLSSYASTEKLCQRIGVKHLLVKLEHEEKFTKAAQKLGFSSPI